MRSGDWAIITGASKGFGTALAEVFAEGGFNLILHGRDRIRLETLTKIIARGGVQIEPILGDLKEQATLNRLTDAARGHNLACLVNNAAVICPGLPLEQINDAQVEEMLEVNLTAVIRLTRFVYEIFCRRGSGTIVNINSLAGREPKRLRSLYCASKWGLRGFTESLALEAVDHNIRVLGVYLSKLKTSPEDSYGMDPLETARKVLAEAQSGAASGPSLVIDGRPPQYRPEM